MRNKNKISLLALYAGYFLTAVAPVLTVIALNWKDYVNTPSKTVSLASGGLIAIVLLIMQIMGKTTANVHRLVKFGVLTLACWSLNALIDQLCLLVSCAFGGEFLSWAIFTIPIQKVKEKSELTTIKQIVVETQSAPNGRV